MRFLLGLLLLFGQQLAVADLESVNSASAGVFVFDDNNENTASGSGFFVSDEGHLVTNHHVIENGTGFLLMGPGLKEITAAEVVWSNESLDLALMKVSSPVNQLPRGLPLYSGAVFKTIDVYTYGYPGTQFELQRDMVGSYQGFVEPTVSKGIVSRVWLDDSVEWIQHSAEVRTGNSGGPLVNECGLVFGVNTAITIHGEAEKDNFAVSVRELISVLGDRVPGLRTAASCDGAMEDVETEKRTDQEEAPSKIAEREKEEKEVVVTEANQETVATNEELFILFIFVLVCVLLVLLFTRKDRETSAQSKVSQDHSSSLLTNQPVTQTLLKLAGFDHKGSPVSLDINRDHTLSSRGYVVGRSRAFSDLAIDYPRLSRAHIHFTYANGSVYVADLNSTNGTFLNNIQLGAFVKTRVNPSDELRIADITLAISR